jgi:hypothetical protein
LSNSDGTRQEGFWDEDRFIGERPDDLLTPRLKLVSHAASATG